MTARTLPSSGLAGPTTSYPHGGLIDVIVDQHASRQPAAVALRHQGTDVTYLELATAAHRVATALLRQGVRPGAVVGVRAEPSPAMIATLLGILRCGAAYAAIPPQWPLERWAQVLEKSGASRCVTEGPAAVPAGVLGIDLAALVGSADGGPGPRPPARTATGADPCCVFLTSGSTGEPKAILAPHQGIVRIAQSECFDLDGVPVAMPQFAPIAWDAYAMELWVPLVQGGTSVLTAPGDISGTGVRRTVREGANALFLTASLFESLIEDDPACFAGLRIVMAGGERTSAARLADCRRRHPALRVTHCYGPAEATIYTTTFIVPGPEPLAELPIGTPVADTTVYLLDGRQRPVAPGEVGELAIAGDGLAIGYLSDPEETARRFPVLELDGRRQRVYLTGDLARCNADGQLVFLGRNDRQVKLRGVRIEPDELERVIETVPGVRRAAVLALPLNEARKTRLAAFYTHNGEAPRPAVVLDRLRAALPSGFLPDLAQPVRAMPRLANGKVDQAALARLVPAVRRPGTVAPDGTGVLGHVLRELADLLGYPCGPDDGLVDSGTTSMTAIRLATRLARLCNRPVTAADVLTARTPAALAEAIDALPVADPQPARAVEDDAVEADAVQPGVPVPPSLRKFWDLADSLPQLQEALVPLLFRLSGQVDPALLRAALDAVVARHDVLRSRFYLDGGELRAQILPGDQIGGLLMVENGPPVGFDAAVAEARGWLLAPANLVGTIPLRARLIPTDRGYLLAIVAHHIACDGWSTEVFCRDLVRAHDALRAGRPAFDDEPPSFYAAAEEQRRYHAGGYDEELRYWSELVRDVPWLRFPGRPDVPPVGPIEDIELPLTAELLALAGRAAATVGGTATAVLLACYVRGLRRYLGVDDLAVSVPLAGRSLPGSENCVGCFAGGVGLRLPAAVTDPVEVVAAAADQLARAVRAPLLSPQDVYPVLPPGYRRHPLAQVYFAPQEPSPARLRFDGMRAEKVPVRPRQWVAEVAMEVRPLPEVGGMLRYRTDVIPGPAAHRFVAEWAADVAHLAGLLIEAP